MKMADLKEHAQCGILSAITACYTWVHDKKNTHLTHKASFLQKFTDGN